MEDHGIRSTMGTKPELVSNRCDLSMNLSITAGRIIGFDTWEGFSVHEKRQRTYVNRSLLCFKNYGRLFAAVLRTQKKVHWIICKNLNLRC